MAELFDLHTARGIELLVCCIAMAILGIWLIYELISLVIINRRLRKLAQALEELDCTQEEALEVFKQCLEKAEPDDTWMHFSFF